MNINEDVGAMIPQIGLDGTAKEDSVSDKKTKKKMVLSKEDEIDLPFSESLIDYINNPKREYDFLVEEGVKEVVNKITERPRVSVKLAKLVTQIHLIKRRLYKTHKSGLDKEREINLKRELIQKEKELRALKKSSSPKLHAEISKIEANVDKNTRKYDIE